MPGKTYEMRFRSPWFRAFAALLTAPIAYLTVGQPWLESGHFSLIGVAITAFLALILYMAGTMRVVARVEGDALHVRLAPWGLLSTTVIPLTEIESVQRIHRQATLTTGYGYRLTRRGMRYVVGTGDGVRIERYGRRPAVEIILGEGAEGLARELEGGMVAPVGEYLDDNR